MASANWKKMTMQAAGSMYVHLDNAARITHNHDNKDIDTSRTNKNYILGQDSFKSAVRSLKSRTKEVDAILPPMKRRKDRVVCCMIEYTCPMAIEEAGQEDEFFREMHRACSDYFGAENVHATFVHKDEKHRYIDSRTKEEKESLYHAHCMVSTFVPGKGINGREFETRARLNAFNALINKRCLERFGIEYNTHSMARKQSVEEMKIESRIAELELSMDALMKNVSNKEKELEAAAKAVDALEALVKKANTSIDCPDVKESKRGFIKKESVVVAPKDTWDATLLNANIKTGVFKAFDEIRGIIADLRKTETDEDKESLKKQIMELRSQLKELNHRIVKTETIERENIEFKKALKKLDPGHPLLKEQDCRSKTVCRKK